ncbi:LysR family transcriptional regulator [bacterium M00.F.Ca.ET.228.01.1.1]|uniref:LysR family transcriptional regulator n=1 Tax=Paraburkholderia phenoliruptrix TaxID=252970 RepID=UPI001092D5C0|nr:LysR family transcriptional regulator [Paraburkholderia phenoliruptrix]TGP46007.1 LysR family transcriptional regulator [bacterium M00.F.Ca.ET.228.01.1.1]TGS04080.1 LysR family transcriptional regulator [bacterium M00.F.Ca.ET.191.01.1.1]TGU07300.1 LysR family transcriptional regulator [bacterium M00.F.Ca.ET.155.01.1.1]MBW0446541.1 LysR family transcriptional regulator [Paraburkholderia phenoliruptrix]MBW9097032.1 LysR family transcriptional regulator [Paraburkholderia phenoliruptrix]
MRKLLEPSLYYFSVVAQTGSLTSATEKLGLTVSALSRHIAKLEGDIGVPLFERHARGMVLSHAGRLLFRHAQRTLADAQAVFDEIQGDERRRARTLTIACTEGFAFDFLPVSLGAFCAQQPDVAIRLEVVPAERASQMLLSGEASIGLAFTFKPEPGVLVQFTQRAPVMALMHNDHPLASRPQIALKDLPAYPVLLQDKGTTNRQLFDIACSVEGIEIEPMMTSRYVAALYRFAQAVPNAIMPSGYVSVAKRLAVDHLTAIPFDNPLLAQRRLQVITLAGRQLDDLAQECLDWIVEDLKRTSERA